MKTLLAAIPACALFAACSTIRLTPSAAERLKRDSDYLGTIQKEIDAAQAAVNTSKSNASAKASALLLTPEVANLTGNVALPAGDNEKVDKARVIASEPQAETLSAAEEFRTAAIELDSANWTLNRLVRDRSILRKVYLGEYEYFVEGSLYFSIEPVVAMRPGLEAVAIPSLGINYRPIKPGHPLSAWATQLILGGALNPSNDSDEGSTGALGFGLSHPIAGSGAVSFGAVAWKDDDDSRVAPYVSITLGDFAKKVTR